MAFVALSRVRSLLGVHLTAFSPTSTIASRTCEEEVNYDLPAKKSGKRKMTGNVDDVPPRVEETVSKGVKGKRTDQERGIPAERPKNSPLQSKHAGQSKRNSMKPEQLIKAQLET